MCEVKHHQILRDYLVKNDLHFKPLTNWERKNENYSMLLRTNVYKSIIILIFLNAKLKKINIFTQIFNLLT